VCISTLSVCVFVRDHNNLHLFLCVTYGRDSVFLLRRCDILCTSGFMYHVMFAHKRSYWGMSIPLHTQLTSSRRRAQANAPAASYWSRRILDGGGRRAYRSPPCNWCLERASGGGACNVIVQLVKSTCFPLLYYGLEACALRSINISYLIMSLTAHLGKFSILDNKRLLTCA